MTVPKHQSFCFTHNNYSPADVAKYRTFCQSFCQFIAWGCETAPTTGTPHLQGYLWTCREHTLQQVKRKCPGAAVFVPGHTKGPSYWLVSGHKGPPITGYIFKENAGEQHGFPPSDEEHIAQCPKGQGNKTNMLEVKKLIDEGKSCQELMLSEDHFAVFAKYRRFFEEYQALKRRRTAFSKPEIVCYYGKTGLSKTRRVYEDNAYGDLDQFFLHTPQMGQWFDGYCGQPIVLFDEFRGTVPFGMLLTLLDGYPCVKVQVKGGMVDWSPTKIFLTSAIHPKEWYPNLQDDDKIDQLLRRIDRIVHCQSL